MSQFRFRGFVVPASVYAALALVSTQIPLFNYLGYEFSALIGLSGAVLSGLLVIHYVKPLYRASDPSTEVFARFKQQLLFNLAALVVPLVIMLTNALFVKNCSLLHGLSFFILIPAVSVIFGSTLGFLCAVHYRFSKMMFIGYCKLTFLYSIAVGYFTPAIFSYSFLYGYFPGLTYDESLGLSWALVFFRLFTVLIAALLVWLSLQLTKHSIPKDTTLKKGISLLQMLASPQRRIVTVPVVLGLILVWVLRGEIGLEATSKFIQSKLGSSYTTEHFTIFYSKESYNSEEIKWIAAEHEFRLGQIADAFFITFQGRIESFIYPSNETKQRFIGTGTTNIAKPWSGQIHITKQSLDGTLKHELIHVVAGRFGLPVIHASLSTGLVEGLAEAVDWDWGNRTPHQYAAAMRKFGVLPGIESLMLLTGFATQASSVSYVVCGSFCRFLIDRYGIRKMAQVYRSGDYDAAYGRSLHQLVGEWQGFLDRVQVSDQDRDAIDVIFRRPPIFKKVCARVTAGRNIQAAMRFTAEDYASAEELYKQSYEESKSYESLSGYLASALRRGESSVLTTTLDSILLKEPHPTQYLPLYLNIGLAAWSQGETAKARDLFSRVEAANISEGLTETAVIYRSALEDTSSRSMLRRYFLVSLNDTTRLALLDSMELHLGRNRVPMYLKGKLLMRLRRYDEARAAFDWFDINTGTGFPENSLQAIRLKAIGRALFFTKRFQEAKGSFWLSLNYLSSEVAVNEVNEWVDRCEWMATNAIP